MRYFEGAFDLKEVSLPEAIGIAEKGFPVIVTEDSITDENIQEFNHFLSEGFHQHLPESFPLSLYVVERSMDGNVREAFERAEITIEENAAVIEALPYDVEVILDSGGWKAFVVEDVDRGVVFESKSFRCVQAFAKGFADDAQIVNERYYDEGEAAYKAHEDYRPT